MTTDHKPQSRSSTTEARRGLSDLVNRSAYGEERFYLTRYGKEVACLVSVQNARVLELLEERMDLDQLLPILERVQAQGSVP